MSQHKWLSPRTFMELNRAYRGGMSYKRMSYVFGMTISQISWYLRDTPKRQKRMPKHPLEVRASKDLMFSPRQMAIWQGIAKRSLKKEIEEAKRERATAPLYRPAPEKVWD